MNELTDHESSVIKLARDYSSRGDIAAFEDLFQAILLSSSSNPRIYWLCGYEYLNNEMSDKSICYFKRAIELDENCMQAWGGLGRALDALERWDEAESAFRRRLELGESANHYVFLAGVLLRQSRYEEVHSCCVRALQLDGQQVDALLNQGVAYSFQGLHEKAVEYCRRAISIDSAYDDAYICLGSVLARADEFEEASDAFQHAIDINPQCAAAYHEFGLLHHFHGDPVLARSYLQSSIDLGRGQPNEEGRIREAESLLSDLEENAVGD